MGILKPKVGREDLSREGKGKLRPPVSLQNGPFDSELETDAKIPRLFPRPLRGNSERYTMEHTDKTGKYVLWSWSNPIPQPSFHRKRGGFKSARYQNR